MMEHILFRIFILSIFIFIKLLLLYIQVHNLKFKIVTSRSPMTWNMYYTLRKKKFQVIINDSDFSGFIYASGMYTYVYTLPPKSLFLLSYIFH